MEKLSCRKRVKLLCDYLDRRVPAAERSRIAAHRRSCRPCSELLASLERTISTLKSLKHRTKAPASLRSTLRRTLRRS